MTLVVMIVVPPAVTLVVMIVVPPAVTLVVMIVVVVVAVMVVYRRDVPPCQIESSDDGLLFTAVTSCSVTDSIKGLKGLTAESPLLLTHRVLTYGVQARCGSRSALLVLPGSARSACVLMCVLVTATCRAHSPKAPCAFAAGFTASVHAARTHARGALTPGCAYAGFCD